MQCKGRFEYTIEQTIPNGWKKTIASEVHSVSRQSRIREKLEEDVQRKIRVIR